MQEIAANPPALQGPAVSANGRELLARATGQNGNDQRRNLLQRYAPHASVSDQVCSTGFTVPLEQDRLASYISNFYSQHTGGRQCMPENVTVELLNAVRQNACSAPGSGNRGATVGDVQMCMLTSYAYGRALASRIVDPMERMDPCIRTAYRPASDVDMANRMISQRVQTTLKAAAQTSGQ